MNITITSDQKVASINIVFDTSDAVAVTTEASVPSPVQDVSQLSNNLSSPKAEDEPKPKEEFFDESITDQVVHSPAKKVSAKSVKLTDTNNREAAVDPDFAADKL